MNNKMFEKCLTHFRKWNKCQASAVLCERNGDIENAERYRKKQEEHSKAYWSMREYFKKEGIIDEFDQYEDDNL